MLRHFNPICRALRHKLILLIAFISVSVAADSQNLITNGDFEQGNNVGFISNYTYKPTPTGNTNAGEYGVGTNPQPFNTSSFVSMGDHTTGTGNMLIVDGTNYGGNPDPFFWRVGTTGEICGLQVGLTYTFSYWIKSIYDPSISGSSVADVRIKWNNITGGQFISPVSGSTLAPVPGANWQKVTYTFVPTNACVRIEMYDQNGSFAGNDFAIDDIELLPPPQPLGLSYSKSNVTCFGAANGAIVAYAYNGIKPYVSYTLTGPSTITNATGIFSNLAPGTYTLSVTDSKPETVTQSSIVISQPADLIISPTTATICSGDNQTLTATGGGATYNWTSSPAGPALPTTASITVSPIVTTTYTATSTTTTTQELIFNGDFSSGNIGFGTDYQYYSPDNPTGAQRAYGIVSSAFAWESFFSACTGRGGTGNMLVADGSTFNSGNDRVWSQTVPVIPGQSYNFSYWFQALTNNNPANLEVTINGVVVSTGLIGTVTCSWVQRTATWNSGVATQATIVIYDRTVTPSGNDFALDDISFTTTVNCNLTKSVTVNVNTGVTTTGFSYVPASVCITGTNPTPTTVSGFTTGGTFSSSAGLSINSSTGAINLGASSPGTYTVTYSVAASGCSPAGSSNTSITITASTPPKTSFSYTTPVCSNGTNPVPALVSGFTTGGTFSSTAGLSINSSTGVIDLSSSTAGTYTVTYSVAASGCNPAGSSNTSITITASTPPKTNFSYTTPVCISGANPVPALVSGFTTGGTFSSTAGLSINSSTGVIDLSSSTAGTYTVTYSVAASGCNPAGSSNTSITITASTPPKTGFSYTSPVCSNGANPVPVLVSGFTTGGVFSSTAGLSINSTTGVIDLLSSTPGTYTVTYSVAASSCNPAGSSNTSITITASTPPKTGFSYTSPVCSNGTNPVPVLVSGFTAGGTFSSTAGLSINFSTGVIDLSSSAAGTYTVTYSVAASGCNPAGSSNTTITITASIPPKTNFSYTTPVCSNGTNPVPTLVSGFTTGGTFSSTAGLSINSSTGVIDLASSTAGTYTVTYSVTASGCNPAGSSTATIVINGVGTPFTGFAYSSPVCINGVNPVPAPVPGFVTGGTYSSTAGLSINSTTGVINLAASSPGTYTVTYTVAPSGCNAGGSSSVSITITPSIAPVTNFNYASPYCANGANPSPTTLPGFTTGGTFSSTTGLAISPSSGTINLAASTPGIYTVTYSVAASGCNPAGSGTATVAITPSITPVTGFSYSTLPLPSVCADEADPVPTLNTNFTTGGIFSSSPGIVVNPSTGVVNLATSTPGTYTITYTVAATGCNPAGSSTAVLQIKPVPSMPLAASPVPFCQNAGTAPLTATGSNLLWYSSATGGTSSFTSPKPSTSTVGLTSYYVTQTINGCESPRKKVDVIINPLPTANAGPDKVTFVGQPVVLSGTATGNFVNIVWTPPVAIVNPTSATPTVMPSVNTTYIMNVTSAEGCAARDEVNVIVLKDIIIPNVFSPNGDGINDKWIITNIEMYTGSRVEIFNRYGQKMAEIKEYNSSNAWDGTNNGKPLPVGAYYYVIRVPQGRQTIFSGTISILR